jgi:hypothetical protein
MDLPLLAEPIALAALPRVAVAVGNVLPLQVGGADAALGDFVGGQAQSKNGVPFRSEKRALQVRQRSRRRWCGP